LGRQPHFTEGLGRQPHLKKEKGVNKMSMKFTTEKNENPLPFKASWVVIGVIVLVVLIALFNCFTIVNEGHVGVKYRFGAVVQSNLNPGLQLKIPFIEEIRPVDMREQAYLFQGNAFTQDNQPVNDLHLKATYRFERAKLAAIISDVGVDNVEDRYFALNVQRIAKIVIGMYDAETLVQSRSEIQQKIEDELSPWLADRGVILTSFSIENINFEAAFLDAVESKIVAEQRAREAENRTKEREHEAEQRVIAAQAEADSLLIQAEAEAAAIELILNQIRDNPEYIAYLKIINWNGILPQVIGDGVNPFVVLGADGSVLNDD
jgi:regulator of protease activity HflC (stomatin/prohibitin superfamily)